MYRKIIIGIALLSMMTFTVARAQGKKDVIDKNIEKIVGTWKIQKIMSGKNEVAKNPTSGQWIEFRSDGKYVNNATSLDSGSYRLNENNSALYLESQVHVNDDAPSSKKTTNFTISFTDGNMILQPLNTGKKSHVDVMKYVYIKIADASALNNN